MNPRTPFVHSTVSESMTSVRLDNGDTVLTIANGHLCLEVLRRLLALAGRAEERSQ